MTIELFNAPSTQGERNRVIEQVCNYLLMTSSDVVLIPCLQGDIVVLRGANGCHLQCEGASSRRSSRKSETGGVYAWGLEATARYESKCVFVLFLWCDTTI